MNGGEAGVIGLCMVLAGCITWIAKGLLKALTNDLAHIKERLGKLPCEEHARQLGQHDAELERLEEGED